VTATATAAVYEATMERKAAISFGDEIGRQRRDVLCQLRRDAEEIICAAAKKVLLTAQFFSITELIF
jgi:hypothetical protein